MFTPIIEDNSKLIELYEQAAAENNNRNVNKGEDGQEIGSKIDNGFCRVVFVSCFCFFPPFDWNFFVFRGQGLTFSP